MTANKATPEELVQQLRYEAAWQAGNPYMQSFLESQQVHYLLAAAADLIESLQKQPVDTTALPITAQCESPRAEFEVLCNDEFMASTSGPRESALKEALYYAFQYTSEGKVTLYEVTRTIVPLHELATE